MAGAKCSGRSLHASLCRTRVLGRPCRPWRPHPPDQRAGRCCGRENRRQGDCGAGTEAHAWGAHDARDRRVALLHEGGGLGALLLEALLRRVQVHPPVSVVLDDVVHVGRLAMQVDVVAARLGDQPRRCPHADTPTVAVVCADIAVPLEGLLARDLPEVAFGPPGKRLATRVQELRTEAVRGVVVALVVAISGALARAHREVSPGTGCPCGLEGSGECERRAGHG
mmetsp:Transcript_57895/g.179912  ORF Transcript_57895/g.179912 Transcript_57895/m.179912 type:complete len:225 (-) Transcript_57895:105-779(-)